MKVISHSVEQTEQLAGKIAFCAVAGDFLVLRGGLGAGKTAFVRGFAHELGSDEVSSPTFSIVHEYQAQLPLFHMDLYRLQDEFDLEAIGYEEYTQRQGIILMEWAERVESILPADRLEISLQHIDANTREISLELFGCWQDRKEALEEVFEKGIN